MYLPEFRHTRNHPRRPRDSQSRRDETRIGTGVKFSSKARRAPGNIPLTDEFQSELNSDFLIGRKFPRLSFFRPIREPHTMKSDRDFLYQVINTTSTVAIFFPIALLVWLAKQTYHAAKIWVAKGPARCKIQPILPRRFCFVGAIICTCVKSKCLVKTPSKSRVDYWEGTVTSRGFVFRRELILL